MALALVHHLSIANNVPLELVAEAFSRLGEYLILEFVPKMDSQVQRLLANRVDIFPSYTRDGLEHAFTKYFSIIESGRIGDSERVLYLMRKRN